MILGLIMNAGDYHFPMLQLQGLCNHYQISWAKLVTNYGGGGCSFFLLQQANCGCYYLMRTKSSRYATLCYNAFNRCSFINAPNIFLLNLSASAWDKLCTVSTCYSSHVFTSLIFHPFCPY